MCNIGKRVDDAKLGEDSRKWPASLFAHRVGTARGWLIDVNYHGQISTARAVIRDAKRLFYAYPLFQCEIKVLVAGIGEMGAHSKNVERRLRSSRPKDLDTRAKGHGSRRRNCEDSTGTDWIKYRPCKNRVRVTAVIHQ